MKKNYYLLLCCLMPFGAIAQPTIQNALKYNVGATVTNVFCNPVSPGSSGANVTWDFTGLVVTSDTGKYWYLAASSPDFPTANMLEKNNNDFYVYVKKAFGQDEIVGLADSSAQGMNITIKYNDPVRFFERPLFYGLNFTDNFTETYSYNGIPLAGSGTINVKVDGHGTLKLPGGVTYNDVLRVVITQTQTDQSLAGPVDVDLNRTMWFDAAHYSPLMRIDNMEINSPAGGYTNNTAEILHNEYDPLSITSVDAKRLKFEAAFAGANLQLSANFSSGKQYEVSVTGMDGKTVFTNTFRGNGNNQVLAMQDMATGVYLVTLTEKGNSSSANAIRVVKQ